jgi:hypothetical protein
MPCTRAAQAPGDDIVRLSVNGGSSRNLGESSTSRGGEGRPAQDRNPE